VNDDSRTIDDVLSGLSSAAPDAARAQRVRDLCCTTLLESRRPAACAPKREARRWVESAIIGGFCAVYFSGVALMALHTHGLL
jgi:hypothetical protein